MPSGLTAGSKGAVLGAVRGGPSCPGAVLLRGSSPEPKAVMR